MEIICSCFTGGEKRKEIHSRLPGRSPVDESSVRDGMKKSNGIKFRHISLFKVIEPSVAYPSVHVMKARSYAAYNPCHA